MYRLIILQFGFMVGCGGLAVDAKLIEHSDTATDDSPEPDSEPRLSIETVELSPSPVYTNDILTAIVSVTPEDASMTYDWHVVDVQGDGVDNIVQSGASASLDGSVYFERGQFVYVTVTAEYNSQDSAKLTSEVITVANTPPTAPAQLGISPSPGVAGYDDLTCSVLGPSIDADGDNIKYAFEWYAPNDALIHSVPPSPNIESILDGGLTAEGAWRCRVISSDRTDIGESTDISVMLEEPSFAFEFTEHTFTTCSNAGHIGPTLNDCQSAYSSEQWVLGSFFDVNDGVQAWFVPASGVYQIQVGGAQGGGNHCGDPGGLGAEMQGEFELNQGDWIHIIVGQEGVTSSSGNCANGGGGGGGGSFVWIDGEASPLIVAGGGGGSGLTNNGYPNCLGMDAPITSDGTAARDGSPGGTNGGDGNNGGGTGWNNIQLKPQGSDGSSNTYNGTGGFGGGGRGGNPMDCNNNQHSPGAGGGYSGGGATVTCYHAGGAGGSFNTGDNTVETAGANSGSGWVTITYLGQ